VLGIYHNAVTYLVAAAFTAPYKFAFTSHYFNTNRNDKRARILLDYEFKTPSGTVIIIINKVLIKVTLNKVIAGAVWPLCHFCDVGAVYKCLYLPTYLLKY